MLPRIAFLIYFALSAPLYAQGLFKTYFPELNGLIKVNSYVFIDDETQAENALKLIKAAEFKNLEFFGKLRARPKYIICTKQLCANRFGLQPTAVTIGHQRIVVGPRGLAEQVFVHERVHAEVNKEVGLLAIASGRIPMWFNEGLASYVAKNTFGIKPSGLRIRHEWVRQAKTTDDWNKLLWDHGAGKTYRAAQFLVGDIARRVGDEALARFVAGLGDVRDFDAALAELLRGT